MVMVVIALAAFACILYVGFDAVYDRFASLHDTDSYKTRWQILKDLAASYKQFPLLGTGLGTHSVVYPMFKSIDTNLLFTHAENEYAQTVEETGLVGLVALIVFGIIVWSGYARNLRNTRIPVCSAAYGLGFGLLAILIHSLSDFGQHLPANAFLSAIFCGLLLSLARQGKISKTSTQTVLSLRNSKRLRLIAFLCVSGIWVWALSGANNARIAEAYWKAALDVEKGLVEKDWHGTKAEYDDLISHAAAASGYQPENMHYRYSLNVFRWYSISKVTDSGCDIENGIISEDSILLVRDIVDQLNEACTFCPTYGPTYSVAGQLEQFVFNDNSGAAKIRKGFRLAPCDPIACFIAGRLDVMEGKIEASIPKFEKAVRVDGRLFKDVVNIYIYQLSRPRLAISAAKESIGKLRYVAKALDEMQYNDLAEQCREKIKDLLEEKCSQPGAPAGAFATLAGIYRKQHNIERAVECYRSALELDYGRVHWRLALAKLLGETGRISEAIRQARICLRLRPQFTAAKRLIEKLVVMPAVVGNENNNIP